MKRSLGLLKHKLVGSSHKDGDGFILSWASSYLYNLLVRSSANLLNKTGSSELFSGKLVDVSNWSGACSLANKVNIVSLDILDDHNLLLGQEMESQFVNSVSQDALLDEEDVDTGGDNLLNQVNNILSFFFQNSVHCGVIVNNNIVLKICLWS